MDRPYKIVDSTGRFWGEKLTEKFAKRLANDLNQKWQNMGSSLRAMYFYAPDRRTI